jgi:hypothetical protein
VTLTIDESGKLIATSISGDVPPALRRTIARTVALIRGRSFTAKRATVHLHIVATVSPDVVHDGLHGDVFAIGGTFTENEGNAFFALAIGRRIDLRVRSRD